MNNNSKKLHVEEVKHLIDLHYDYKSIARRYGCSRVTVTNFINKNKLKRKKETPVTRESKI